MLITPDEILERYQKGERNFAGLRMEANTDNPDVLDGADLSNIILSGIYWPGARLRDVNLTEAKLVGAYMPDADLTLADLTWADLSGATLRRACLECTNLTGAMLQYANLIQANLEGADTIDVIFEYSVLCQLNLTQVRPAGYPIDRVNIHCVGALLWNTVMPDGTFIAEPEYDTRY
jgi:uncharacterized protein YjbI with pentapeptide repeats